MVALRGKFTQKRNPAVDPVSPGKVFRLSRKARGNQEKPRGTKRNQEGTKRNQERPRETKRNQEEKQGYVSTW